MRKTLHSQERRAVTDRAYSFGNFEFCDRN